jgi:hypothetical protein
VTVGKDEFVAPLLWDSREFALKRSSISHSVHSTRTRRVSSYSSLTRKLLFEICSPVDILLIWNELTNWESDFYGFLCYNIFHSTGV